MKTRMSPSIDIIPFAIVLKLVLGCYADEPHPLRRSRADIAAAMSRVTAGMPQHEVFALLGKPDDKRTENDAGGIRTARTREIWRYGATGHLTPATLGKVYIDEDGVLPQLKLEFSGVGVSITPRAGEFDECNSEWPSGQWLSGQWLTAA